MNEEILSHLAIIMIATIGALLTSVCPGSAGTGEPTFRGSCRRPPCGRGFS